MSIANTCVILHNLIVRMQQNGDFRDKADGAYLITEVLYVDGRARTEAAVKYEAKRWRIRSKITMDWEQQVV